MALTLPSLERRINRLFAYYLGIASVWSFTSFMLHLNAFPQQALFWNELLVIAMFWALIAYYHFMHAYVNKPVSKTVYIGYGLVPILTFLSLNGNLVQYAYVTDGVLYHSLGISLYFYGAICATFIGAVLYELIKKYRTAPDSIDRNRTAYLLAGWSIMVLLSYTNLIKPLDGIPLDHIGSLVNVLIIAYAIRRYQLIDIRIVMRKGLVYSSLTVFLTTIYLILLFSLQMLFHDWLGYTSLAIITGFALLVAILLNPLRNFIQKWIDHLFYRETYDYRQVLLNFSDRISNVLDLGELAQTILEPIVNSMHARQAALLFPDAGSGEFNTHFLEPDTEEDPPARLRLLADSPIVSWLANEGKALQRELIDYIPQFKGLWEVERTALSVLGVELLCPIRIKGNLIGILSLAKKQSDAPYSVDEINLLMTMANEAAIAVENAQMLDSLKVQQKQVEQLLAQIVQAQEEERNRISNDLHDSVAQWLVAASYRVQSFSHALSGKEEDKFRDELANMENTLDKSVKELRRVVIGLRPPALEELGLTHALQQSLDELKTNGTTCKFTIEGTPARLPSSMEIVVYRIVQEAVTNIRKHANASMVTLLLQFQEDRLMVEIHDNGTGFRRSQTMNSDVSVGHIGLMGMRQRAGMLGGDLKIKTREGAGTTITLSLPIPIQVES